MGSTTKQLALVHLLSRCKAPAAYPECRRQNTTVISRTIGEHLPAVIPGYLSYLSFKLTLTCYKLYENLTYTLHVAGGYRVKLQRQEYTE